MKVVLAFGITLAIALPASAQAPVVDYLRDIKPILKERCFACHGALKQTAGLRLDTGAMLRRGGEGGPAVVAGKVAESLLVERITSQDDSLRMPAEGKPLTAEQRALFKAWVEQGAMSPENEQPEPDPREHWAFKKPSRPVGPEIRNSKSEVRNEVDAFVAAKLEAAGIEPRPSAEKHVLLRRVYLDLIGLPPTREELRAFLADESPTAYEDVVDRLLRDPRHGERWARHWMDLWRYADWHGRRHVPDVWNSAPQIWRWRDWIVRSLNNDHGYDRMIREMLAADEVCPEDDEATVATGYLIRNWYALNPNDWMRSTVEHTGKAFLGLTFNCAHCHDHKYDPITQEDYFRLRAFFEPIYIRQDREPGEADPGPFEDYDYGKLRKIQRLGAVRIFDKTPDAPTWFYTGGDERNRVKERGSISPGVPAFLQIHQQDAPASDRNRDSASATTPNDARDHSLVRRAHSSLPIAPINLPTSAFYPGLRPAIVETMLKDARAAIATVESQLSRVPKSEASESAKQQLAQAEAAYGAAAKEAEQSVRPGALVGKQSLLFDATAGRRTLHNGVQHLKSLDDGTTFSFQLLILNDAHFNFQFAKDIVKGLTSGYIAFEKGRVMSYQPSSFTEFEAGRYDFAAGQKRFVVSLKLETKADRCLLSVRSLTDDKLLVDAVPVALNGWNPVGDATKALSFDARTGSVAVIDDVVLTAPAVGDAAPIRVAFYDFEAPTFTADRDIVGIAGWATSSFAVAPATSVVSTTAGNGSLRELWTKLLAARRAVDAASLPARAAESKLLAARADLASLEARIAADRAKFGEVTTTKRNGEPEGGSPRTNANTQDGSEGLRPSARQSVDVISSARNANRLEREASLRKAEAEVLAQENALAVAEAKPMTDMNRAKEVDAATKGLAAARPILEKAKAAANEPLVETYTPLGPTYAKTSTGRRKALTEWMTSRDNPLTARVAVNHIWSHHFHQPLVTSITDFGRNGAKPTHPELLDWLAVEFMDSGWSMKHLHRLIVTSAAYRRVSSVGVIASVLRPSGSGQLDSSPGPSPDGRGTAINHDPENRLLWHMNPGRMEAEVVRDSVLFVAGKLDPKLGGQELENTDALKTFRRSLYYSVFPEQGGMSPLGELFDAPNPLDCYRRTKSIVPQQALALTNSEMIHKVSTDIVVSLTETTAGDFITAAFERILSRQPTASEIATCAQFLTNPADTRSRESLVRVLLNHNDFVTIR